jgi:hypothetical protein
MGTPKRVVEWRGGANVGGAGCLSPQVSWPGAHLIATENRIEFETELAIFPFFPSGCSLDKSSVIAVREYKGLSPLDIVTGGVQIVHNDKNSPPFVVLWTFRPKKLLRELRALGYRIGKRRWWWDTFLNPERYEV